jgi:hypothetical protein
MLGRWDTERLRVHYQIKFFLPRLGLGLVNRRHRSPPPPSGDCVGSPPGCSISPILLYYLYDLPNFPKFLLQRCQLKTKILHPTTTPSRRRRPYPIPPPGHGLRTGGGGQSTTPSRKRVTRSSIKLQSTQDPPPPPEGGGATNPPPPDEHTFTQSDGSPSLLTPPSLSHEGADLTDFITVTAASGL